MSKRPDSSLRIIFGQLLDGCPLPDDCLGIDRLVVGPRGMLDFLGERLGLAPPRFDRGGRLMEYRIALDTVAKGSHVFYSRSLAVDSFGATRALLEWRDDLFIAGWNREWGGASPRLTDLAAVEEVFEKSEAYRSGVGWRLQRFASALKDGGKHGVAHIDLADTLDAYPLLWRRVLQLLPVSENAFPLPGSPLAKPGTTLHDLQNRLLFGGHDKIQPSDRSVQIVQSHIPANRANAAAAILANYQGTGSETTVIARPETVGPLNRALADNGLPVIDAGSRTSSSTLTQLPALLLRLHWKPADPRAWLEFLLHPVTPIHSKLARRLAFSIQATPSRDSEAWQKTIDEVLADTDDSQEKQRIRKQVGQWLSPERFAETATPETLAQTIHQLAKWAVARGGMQDSGETSAVWKQVSASFFRLEKLIESSQSNLTREDVARLISEWLADAQLDSIRTKAELGGPANQASPAHVLQPTDHVVWWLPGDIATSRQPWSRPELEWLTQNGVVFPDEEALRRQANDAVTRPVLLARKSITMFPAETDGVVEAHLSSVLVRLEAALGETIIHSPEEFISTAPCDVIPMQAPRREWQVSSPELLVPRKTESFSSLNQFLYSPWEWVLNYCAKLRPGSQFDFRIIDDSRRRGSLLHGFVESLLEPEMDPLAIKEDHGRKNHQPAPGVVLEDTPPATGLVETLIRRLFDTQSRVGWQNISKADVNQWVESQWDELLRKRAAHYLVAGNEAAKSELLYFAKNGIGELLRHLEEADVVRVRCEEPIEKISFFGGKLGGIIDLQLENSSGQLAVIDLKLGGKTYRRTELEQGRHLQLATYGHLVRARHGVEANCAYFIFMGGGELLARSDAFFPTATVVPTVIGEPPVDEWQTCWEEFETLWQWRRNQFDQGKIDITLSRFKPTLDPAHWTVPEPDKYSDYLTVAGAKAFL